VIVLSSERIKTDQKPSEPIPGSRAPAPALQPLRTPDFFAKAAGQAGTLVTTNGNHFTTKPKACTVTINGKVAAWTTWSNTKIQKKVATGVTSGKVVLTAFFQQSNGVTFTVN
jgi:hypothetical protein